MYATPRAIPLGPLRNAKQEKTLASFETRGIQLIGYKLCRAIDEVIRRFHDTPISLDKTFCETSRNTEYTQYEKDTDGFSVRG